MYRCDAPVTQGYAGMTIWTGKSIANDFIEPCTRSIRRLSFVIRTSRGDIVNLQGGHWPTAALNFCNEEQTTWLKLPRLQNLRRLAAEEAKSQGGIPRGDASGGAAEA